MQNTILKIYELSELYYDFAIKMKLRKSTTITLMGNGFVNNVEWAKSDWIGENMLIYIFIHENYEYTINFEEVKYTSYSERIEFPFFYDEQKLYQVYDVANQYLQDYLIPNVLYSPETIQMRMNSAKIEKLENEIKKLKSKSKK